jgi:large subunit ribosomal protein L20
MSRVKRGTTANKRRKKTIKAAKGFMWSRKTKFKAAKEALLHARTHAFTGRKLKKRNYRRLWQVRINAAVRVFDISYSKFINGLKNSKVEVDRKILSEIAQTRPDVFKQVVELVKPNINVK